MSEKPFFIFLFSIILYIFLYSSSGNEKRGDEILVPKLLRKIVFPFLKISRIPIGFVILSIYFIISNIYVYIRYFITHVIQNNIWHWKTANDIWSFSTFIAMYIMLLIDIGVLAVRPKEKRLDKLLCIFLEIIIIFGGIYIFVIPFFQ